MRFNLTKNSVINYFMPIIFRSPKKQNMLTFIQEEKVTKDLVFVIISFLNPVEIFRLYRTSHAFNELVKQYNKSLISLKDAQNQHITANREFKEQKDLLPKKINRSENVMDSFLYYGFSGILFLGAINLPIVLSFQSPDQTEIFMSLSDKQFSCPNNRVGDALEITTYIEMGFCFAMVVGKVTMECANSYRQRKKVTLAAEKVSQTTLYLKKREQTRVPRGSSLES